MTEYTGTVSTGGEAATRTLQDLTISKFAVSSMNNNCYLLRCRQTAQQVLIDAADDPDRILREAGGEGLATVVTTHRHWDHIRALSQVIEVTGARSLAHEDDAEEIPVVTATLTDGDTISVGECELTAIHLAGHTPGSVALHYADPHGHSHLFTGDSLFPGGVGRTTNPEDFQSLFHDVTTKLFDRFDDDTWVYPGHGNDTTLGEERGQLSEWQARGW